MNSKEQIQQKSKKMDFQDFYGARSAGLARQIKHLRQRGHSFVLGEIATFTGAVVALACVTMTADTAVRLLGAGVAAACLVAYVAIRWADTRNDARIGRLENLKQVYDNELCAQRGDYACFDDGRRYADPHHAYTYDLDIFGPDSLYQRLCRTVTTGGSDALAARLGSLDGQTAVTASMPASAKPLDEAYGAGYQARIGALAADEPFRAAFMAHGVRGRINTDAIGRALETAATVRVPRALGSRWLQMLMAADLTAFYVCIVLAVLGRANGLVPLWWGMLQFFVVYLLCMRPLREVGKAVNRLHGQLRQLVDVARLMDEGRADVFARLSALLDGLDKRGNIMGLVLVDVLGLYDLLLLRRFLRWVETDRWEMEAWMARVVQMDQDVTVATFLYNHPATCWPEVTGEPGVRMEAEGLYHPFLGERAVRNDFRIDDRHFYIITGANMAGKSTFLRAVGVNYVLGRVGMPVFARRLRVSRFRLFSSMRTSDDLAHGISYFNAELLRLQQLKDCLRGEPTLLILDEILKGTNSLDKLNGSRMFLDYVSRQSVSGIVATHDLELSKLESACFHNYCFEIDLGTRVTYSYRITPGVARNQNATFLLRQILGEAEAGA